MKFCGGKKQLTTVENWHLFSNLKKKKLTAGTTYFLLMVHPVLDRSLSGVLFIMSMQVCD